MIGLLLMTGCGQKPVSIHVTPTKLTIYGLKRSTSLTAEVRDKKGKPITGLPITWVSSQPKVATAENGAIKPVGPGKAVITVQSGELSATAQVEVVDVTTINVTPLRSTLAGKKGDTIDFVAEVRNSKDQPIALKPKWEATNPKIATVDENGRVTALAEGRITVTATLGEVGGSGDLRILFREIETFQVTPVTTILPVGRTQPLNIIAKSPDGQAIDDVAVVYSSSDPKTAVASNGMLKAISAGSSEITVTCGPKTAKISVHVLPKEGMASRPGTP